MCVYVHGCAVQQCTKSWRSAAFRASRGASTPARRCACAWARCALCPRVSCRIRQQVRADRLLRHITAPRGGTPPRSPLAARGTTVHHIVRVAGLEAPAASRSLLGSRCGSRHVLVADAPRLPACGFPQAVPIGRTCLAAAPHDRAGAQKILGLWVPVVAARCCAQDPGS